MAPRRPAQGPGARPSADVRPPLSEVRRQGARRHPPSSEVRGRGLGQSGVPLRSVQGPGRGGVPRRARSRGEARGVVPLCPRSRARQRRRPPRPRSRRSGTRYHPPLRCAPRPTCPKSDSRRPRRWQGVAVVRGRGRSISLVPAAVALHPRTKTRLSMLVFVH